jgi:hypothetical protein
MRYPVAARKGAIGNLPTNAKCLSASANRWQKPAESMTVCMYIHAGPRVKGEQVQAGRQGSRQVTGGQILAWA